MTPLAGTRFAGNMHHLEDGCQIFSAQLSRADNGRIQCLTQAAGSHSKLYKNLYCPPSFGVVGCTFHALPPDICNQHTICFCSETQPPRTLAQKQDQIPCLFSAPQPHNSIHASRKNPITMLAAPTLALLRWLKARSRKEGLFCADRFVLCRNSPTLPALSPGLSCHQAGAGHDGWWIACHGQCGFGWDFRRQGR